MHKVFLLFSPRIQRLLSGRFLDGAAKAKHWVCGLSTLLPGRGPVAAFLLTPSF